MFKKYTRGFALAGAIGLGLSMACTWAAPTQSTPKSQPLSPAAMLAQQVDVSKLPAEAQTAARVDIDLLDAPEKLAQAGCEPTQWQVPRGGRLWGKSLVLVQCAGKETPMYVTVDAKIIAPVVVAATAVAFQETLQASHFQWEPKDITKLNTGYLLDDKDLLGRISTRGWTTGTVLRADMVKTKPAIQTGDTIRLVVQGTGFKIESEGTAMAAAQLGQSVRVKTPQGKVVNGTATAPLLVEVNL